MDRLESRVQSRMREYHTLAKCIYRAKRQPNFKNNLIAEFDVADLLAISVPCSYSKLISDHRRRRNSIIEIININKFFNIIKFQEEVYRFIIDHNDTTTSICDHVCYLF